MVQLLNDLNDQAREWAANPSELGGLERSDREAELEEWLEDHGFDEPWKFSSALVDMGHALKDLDELDLES